MTHNAIYHIYFPGLRSNSGGYCTSCHVSYPFIQKGSSGSVFPIFFKTGQLFCRMSLNLELLPYGYRPHKYEDTQELTTGYSGQL